MSIPPWLQRAFDRCESCALDNQADRERLAAAILDERRATGIPGQQSPDGTVTITVQDPE